MGGLVQPMFDLGSLSKETVQKLFEATKQALQAGNPTVPVIPGLHVAKAAGVETPDKIKLIPDNE